MSIYARRESSQWLAKASEPVSARNVRIACKDGHVSHIRLTNLHYMDRKPSEVGQRCVPRVDKVDKRSEPG